tara:strand:- start:1149 stop:1397 length:249 start_codon:yes stop_codon:yes gene_type:complete
MKRLFDFRCTKTQLVFERYVDDQLSEVGCKCEATAKRIISPVRAKLDPISGDFPGATMSWIKNREQKLKEERRDTANHGPAA